VGEFFQMSCKLSYLMCRYISERTISLNTQKG
jgi:hypothetical protein